MAMAMRVAGDEEGKGGKAMSMATRIVGKWTVTATKRVMATKKATATAMATRVVGNKEGNGNGGKSNGNGNGGFCQEKATRATVMRVAGIQR